MADDNVIELNQEEPEAKALGVCPFLAAGAIAAVGPKQNGDEMPAIRCIGADCQLWFETQVVNQDGEVVEEVRHCQLALGGEWPRRLFSIGGQMLAASQQRIQMAGPTLHPRQDGH